MTQSSGRTLQALRLHVPPGVAEDSVTRRGEAREVRHLAAGNEVDPAAGGQAEQLAHPAGRDLLDDRQRRGGDVPASVLVPRRCQPVGSHGDRERAADHEAEVARPRGCDQAGLRVASELRDDDASILAVLAQWAGEARAELLDASLRPDRAGRQALDEPVSESHRVVEHLVARVH
jgi:hypothetical protein